MKRCFFAPALSVLLCALLLSACTEKKDASMQNSSSQEVGAAPVQSASLAVKESEPVELLPIVNEIATAEDFVAIENDLDAQYALVADIDLTSVAGYTSLAGETPFTGTLDGDGYTVIAPAREGTDSFALFGTVEGTISNLHVVGIAWQEEEEHAADFAGIALANTGTIEDCTVSGTMDSPGNAAAIVLSNKGQIVRCSSDITVTMGRNVGGITVTNSGVITDCTSTSSLDSQFHTNTSSAGGIAALNNGQITGSVFSGVLTQQNQEYLSSAGGIAGENNGQIENCANTGAITGAHKVGGIAGENKSGESHIIASCYNSGQVTISHSIHEGYAGGITGYNYASVQDCFNLGNISGQGFFSICGGLSGVCHSVGSMENGYSAGSISASVPGACAGYMWSKKIQNLYYISSGPGYGQSAGDGLEAVEARQVTEQQASDSASFEGFNFDTVWVMEDIPLLRGVTQA